MTDIYECSLCGAFVMTNGLTRHMKTKHGITRDLYGKTDIPEHLKGIKNPDFAILNDNTLIGKSNRKLKQGYVVAKWRFEVKGKYNTIFSKGQMRYYWIWVPGHIRRMNKKHKANLEEPKYIEDYLRK